jgi:hypothetical protein
MRGPARCRRAEIGDAMKVCPHCRRPLSLGDVLGLRFYNPSVCSHCGHLIADTWLGDVASFLAFLLATVASMWILVPLGVPLIPLLALGLAFAAASKVLLASPTEYTAGEKACVVCGRLDASYAHPRDSSCIECRRQSPRSRSVRQPAGDDASRSSES